MIQKTFKCILGITLCLGVFWSHANIIHAQEKTFNEVEENLFPGWQSGQNSAGSENEVINGVVGETQDNARIFQYIPRIIDLILKFTAPIVVILVVIAGVKLVIGGEDEEARESAKNFFIYALIGLAFMILSYSIMRTVYNLLATPEETGTQTALLIKNFLIS